MSNKETTCPHCNGHGRVKLKPESARTLGTVERLGLATADAIHVALGEQIDITATHNRLARLVRRKLIKKSRGKPHKFQLA